MWYIIPHTRTKISRTRVHMGTRADFFFGMYQLETRFARIKTQLQENHNKNEASTAVWHTCYEYIVPGIHTLRGRAT